MIRTILAVVTLALLIVPVAAAQPLEEPLIEHVDEKLDDAGRDPASFAQQHASEEAVADEAAWGVAYGCFAVDHAHDEVGTPDPKLDQCEDYEEVLGIAPEPAEPVAVVQNLSEDPVAQVMEIEEEVLASVEHIVEDPLSAPEVLVGLVLYLVGKLLDIVAALGAAASGLLSGAFDLVDAALAADIAMGTAIYEAASDGLVGAIQGIATLALGLAAGLLDGATAVLDGIVSAAESTADGVVDLAASAGAGAQKAADAIGDAASAVGDVVTGFIGALFGDEGDGTQDRGSAGSARDVAQTADGLLDVVGDVGRAVDATV